ncbi:MAG: ion channel [Bacteroidetes bacterium]|nr:ion channel [Bacteroidota bacterium]
MIEKLYPYRFELFLFSQLAILFGSLIIPGALFDSLILPLLFLSIIVTGIVFISKRKFFFWLFSILLLLLTVVSLLTYFKVGDNKVNDLLKMGILFPFFIIVTFEIIRQVWQAKIVSKEVILGLISGYISLGLIGSLLCISIEMVSPGSFSGITDTTTGVADTPNIMYFSYITLMTIGYGDILPLTLPAKKAAILIGLIGQFYLVIITAVVVAKYIRSQN